MAPTGTGEPDVDVTCELPSRCQSRYEPVRVLATGGFGVVYLARHRELGRMVALKLLHAAVPGEGDSVERFVAEAQLTASLNHPNIVRVLDFDVEQGRPWIAYEYLEGESLADRMRSGRLSVPTATEVVRQVADALQTAHERRILHRDVKPDNVFIAKTSPPTYKVLDFGIAKWTSDRGIRTRTGVVFGTPAYMSPEQIRGEELTPASDVYALGIVFFEMLTGNVPFRSDSFIVVLEHHEKMAPRRPSELVPLIPRSLDRIVMRMLEKAPDARYATMADLISDLRSLSGDEDASRELTVAVQARPSGKVAALPSAAAAPRGRGVRWAAGLFFAVVLVIASVAVTVQRWRAPDTPAASPSFGGVTFPALGRVEIEIKGGSFDGFTGVLRSSGASDATTRVLGGRLVFTGVEFSGKPAELALVDRQRAVVAGPRPVRVPRYVPVRDLAVSPTENSVRIDVGFAEPVSIRAQILDGPSPRTIPLSVNLPYLQATVSGLEPNHPYRFVIVPAPAGGTELETWTGFEPFPFRTLTPAEERDRQQCLKNFRQLSTEMAAVIWDCLRPDQDAIDAVRAKLALLRRQGVAGNVESLRLLAKTQHVLRDRRLGEELAAVLGSSGVTSFECRAWLVGGVAAGRLPEAAPLAAKLLAEPGFLDALHPDYMLTKVLPCREGVVKALAMDRRGNTFGELARVVEGWRAMDAGAIEAMIACDPHRAHEQFARWARSQDGALIRAGMEGLSQLATPGAVDALSDRIGQPGDRATWAAFALAACTAPSAKAVLARALAGALRAKRSREDLLWAAGAAGAVEAAPAVLELLRRATDARQRQVVATVLGVLEFRPAVPELCRCLATADPGVRRAAAWALGRVGNREAVPDLLAALARRDAAPHAPVGEIVWALGQIGAPEAGGRLAALLDSASDLTDDDLAICVWSLGRLAVARPAELKKLLRRLQMERRAKGSSLLGTCVDWTIDRLEGSLDLPAIHFVFPRVLVDRVTPAVPAATVARVRAIGRWGPRPGAEAAVSDIIPLREGEPAGADEERPTPGRQARSQGDPAVMRIHGRIGAQRFGLDVLETIVVFGRGGEMLLSPYDLAGPDLKRLPITTATGVGVVMLRR